MQIKSLKQYIIIDSTNLFVSSWVKQNDGAWRFQELDKMNERLLIVPIQFDLLLKDVYYEINFPNNLQRVEK